MGFIPPGAPRVPAPSLHLAGSGPATLSASPRCDAADFGVGFFFLLFPFTAEVCSPKKCSAGLDPLSRTAPAPTPVGRD